MARCHWSTKTATVRERFSLSVIFVVTASFAGLLFLLRWIGMSPAFTTSLCGLVLLIGVAQVALRRWGRPWTVSALAGAAYGVAWNVYAATQGPKHFDMLPSTMLIAASLGAVLGYFAGVINESVFLMHDFVRNGLRAKQTAREKLRAAMGEVPNESPWDD